MLPFIKAFEADKWPYKSAIVIQRAIEKTIALQGHCSVMLTGGRTAARLYKAWANISEFSALRQVSFYFGDERCVSPDDVESNYNLTMRTLFISGVPSGCRVVRMDAEGLNPEISAQSYESSLPKYVDILVLTAGEDGHIASIFPGDDSVFDQLTAKIVYVKRPDLQMQRITITPHTIAEAKEIFLLATGSEKNQPLKKALYSPLNIRLLPIQLTLRGEWLLDVNSASGLI